MTGPEGSPSPDGRVRVATWSAPSRTLVRPLQGGPGLFFILGMTSRRSTIDSGRFHCPNEGATRQFEHVRAKRWFTLFFIPLLPLGTQGEWVRCGGCGASYGPDVPERHPASP